MLKRIARLLFWKLKKLEIGFLKHLHLSKIYTLSSHDLREIRSNESSLSIVIFSKDRPLQLLALLESLTEFSNPFIKPYIIFNCKDEAYLNAYQNLLDNHANLFQEALLDSQQGFKATLLFLLEKLDSQLVTFLVDDIVIKENINWNFFTTFSMSSAVPSLRMGTHLSRCYTANDKQILPPIKKINDYNFWLWKEGEHDWNYPLSLDGNIFSRIEIHNLMKELNFKAPNTLELKLQVYKNKFQNRLGVCLNNSSIINNPVNRVQSEIANLHGSIHQDQLLQYWQEGKRINYKHYKHFQNESCHQELPIAFL